MPILSLIGRLLDSSKYNVCIKALMDKNLFAQSLSSGSDYCVSYMRAKETFIDTMTLTEKGFLRRGYVSGLPRGRRRSFTLPVTLDNYRDILRILDKKVRNGERIELKLSDEEGKPVDLIYEHGQFKIPKLEDEVRSHQTQVS